MRCEEIFVAMILLCIVDKLHADHPKDKLAKDPKMPRGKYIHVHFNKIFCLHQRYTVRFDLHLQNLLFFYSDTRSKIVFCLLKYQSYL